MEAKTPEWPPELGEDIRLPPPTDYVPARLRCVDHCRYCHGVHFSSADYLACSTAAREQGQREQ